MKVRENWKVIVLEPAKSRIARDECPSCGKHKSKWKRRIDWRCCCKTCTTKYNKFLMIYGWQDLRMKAFVRDNFTCVLCSKKVIKDAYGTYALVGDHILPISLGGEEWDLKNVQTLCLECNKEKTREDRKKIDALRRKEKLVAIGQRTL